MTQYLQGVLVGARLAALAFAALAVTAMRANPLIDSHFFAMPAVPAP